MNRFTITAVILLIFMGPAYAYLDPGSIPLQGLIAAVAGTMITAKLYWSRIKSVFSRKTEKSGRESGKEIIYG